MRWLRRVRQQPLITLQTFSFHADWEGLFVKPMHVGTVHVTGMEIADSSEGDAGAGPEGTAAYWEDQDCGG